ncbi:MAG: hypothetical protein AAF989_09345 [Planctomycetota bacterium]
MRKMQLIVACTVSAVIMLRLGMAGRDQINSNTGANQIVLGDPVPLEVTSSTWRKPPIDTTRRWILTENGSDFSAVNHGDGVYRELEEGRRAGDLLISRSTSLGAWEEGLVCWCDASDGDITLTLPDDSIFDTRDNLEEASVKFLIKRQDDSNQSLSVEPTAGYLCD